MNEMQKLWKANHRAEQKARRAMSVIVFVLFACVIGMALMGPFLYMLRCQLVGC